MANKEPFEAPTGGLGTRDRLLSTARELFYSQGYHATSVQQILSEAEVNSGSLYYFFKGKEELLLAVLDQHAEGIEPLLIRPILAREVTPLERILALLEAYRGRLLESDFERGCPIGNLALEVGEENDQIRHKLAANFAGWCRWVSAWLEEQEVPASVAEQTALFVLAVMEGGVMQARVGRSIEPFDASLQGIKRYLEQLLREYGDGETRIAAESKASVTELMW